MTNNLFGSGNEKGNEFATKVDTHSKTLVTIIQRQKDIESLLENIHEKIELIDHNAVSDFKKIFKKNKTLSDEITDLKSEFKKMQEYQEKLSKQLKLFSTIDEVKKLEKYVDLWDPMQFVSRDEFDKELKKNKKETVEQIAKIIETFMK
jgi:predicted  nucleic acid-binding Zn-ribbon protein